MGFLPVRVRVRVRPTLTLTLTLTLTCATSRGSSEVRSMSSAGLLGLEVGVMVRVRC